MTGLAGIEAAQIIAIKRYYGRPADATRPERAGRPGSVSLDSAGAEWRSAAGSKSGGSASSLESGRQAAELCSEPRTTSTLSGGGGGGGHRLEAPPGRALKRLKVYYARRGERRGQASLTKLKRLSLEAGERPAASLEQQAQLLERQLEQQRALRPRSLLLFVNPYGGKGRALQLFRNRVRRLLELAEVHYELIVTKYANHARDTIEDPQFELGQYDGIVCIGGDGMFAELMNGLLFRSNSALLGQQHQQQQQQQQRRRRPGSPRAELEQLRRGLGGFGRRFEAPELPIGIIGAGSTDANLFGLSGTNEPVTATLNIILGQQLRVDVCSLHALASDRVLRFASTFVAYGYFGDVVRESEKLRWLGPARYDLAGASRLLSWRAYEGSVRVWRARADGQPRDSSSCHLDCAACKPRKQPRELQPAPNSRAQRPAQLELLECQGPFVGVNAAITACKCPQTRKGFSPNNHLANGALDLILVRPCSRLQYANYLIRTGYTSKSALDLNFVDSYRCRQFEFHAHEGSPRAAGQQPQPQQPRARRQSSWNADGEVLHEQSIRVKVNKRLLKVFGSGFERRGADDES